MRNNENIIFIDHKGKSHNARVQSFREHRDAKDALIHHEPLVTLNYNGGPGGEPVTLIDVPHISHPNRQENNPELPSYPLHAWKYEHEEHLEIPSDHPVHDHFNAQPERDGEGNIVPKSRPLHEAHIAEHRAKRQREVNAEANDAFDKAFTPGKPSAELATGTGPKPSAAVAEGIAVGHPAHPETVHFPFTCESCGASVTRTASHHGGKQWEGIARASLTPPGTGVEWQEHVCKQEDIDAFRKRLEDAKKPPEVEPSASEKLAAGEKLAPEVEPHVEDVAEAEEADVIAELEKAPPAPNETESKPEDAA